MAISYQNDVKPMFTQLDRDHMLKWFDLWKYDDVKAHADAIHDNVASGKMPPPGVEPRWSPDKVQRFKQWVQDGCLP
jgi:hypothetical protein